MERYIVLYDGYCFLCSQATAFIAYFDWFHRIERVNLYDTARIDSLGITVPEQEKLIQEIHLISQNKMIYTGFYACRKIGILLPITFLFALLLYIPGIPFLGEHFYTALSKRRK